MTVFVAIGFLLYVLSHGFGKVHACLVGYAGQHPKEVGQLVGEVEFFVLLGGLFSLGACHYACHLAHLLGKQSGVGHLVEITHSVFLNPLVNIFLQFL